MEKEGDLHDFDLSISETTHLLGFSCTPISRVHREFSGKRKYPVSGGSLEENALFGVRGEWPDCRGGGKNNSSTFYHHS